MAGGIENSSENSSEKNDDKTMGFATSKYLGTGNLVGS